MREKRKLQSSAFSDDRKRFPRISIAVVSSKGTTLSPPATEFAERQAAEDKIGRELG